MLEVFFGTMSAGKSTKLLQDRYNYLQKNKDMLRLEYRTKYMYTNILKNL